MCSLNGKTIIFGFCVILGATNLFGQTQKAFVYAPFVDFSLSTLKPFNDFGWDVPIRWQAVSTDGAVVAEGFTKRLTRTFDKHCVLVDDFTVSTIKDGKPVEIFSGYGSLLESDVYFLVSNQLFAATRERQWLNNFRRLKMVDYKSSSTKMQTISCFVSDYYLALQPQLSKRFPVMPAKPNSSSDKWGYFNLMENDWVVPPRFEMATCAVNGISIVKLAGEYKILKFSDLQVLDFPTGYKPLETRFRNLKEPNSGYFSGFMLVEKAGGSIEDRAFVDLKRNELDCGGLKPLLPFSEDLGAVYDPKSKMIGFVKPDGSLAIAPAFQRVGSGFLNGQALVSNQTGWKVINRDGSIAFSLEKFEKKTLQTRLKERYGEGIIRQIEGGQEIIYGKDGPILSASWKQNKRKWIDQIVNRLKDAIDE